MYRVVLLPKAERTFARADAPLARKLAKAFTALEADPLQHPNVKLLAGPLKGLCRFRAGDHRVIYRVDTAGNTVYVVRIVHRKEAY